MAHVQNDRKIFKVVSGTVTELASSDQGDSAGHSFEFIITDAKKSVKEAATEILSTTDNTVTSIGDCGLYWGHIGEGNHIRSQWQLDNFVSQSTSTTHLTNPTGISATAPNSPTHTTIHSPTAISAAVPNNPMHVNKNSISGLSATAPNSPTHTSCTMPLMSSTHVGLLSRVQYNPAVYVYLQFLE